MANIFECIYSVFFYNIYVLDDKLKQLFDTYGIYSSSSTKIKICGQNKKGEGGENNVKTTRRRD